MNRKHSPTGRPRRLMPWVVLLALYMACMLIFAWSRMQCRQYEYWMVEVLTRQKALRERHDNLNIELATVRTPARLESQARRLGMIRPTASQTVHVK